MIAGVLIGAGIQMIFLQGLTYIIDVYKMQSASAIAANTFFRSWLGAGFPLFATAFYNKLGVSPQFPASIELSITKWTRCSREIL